MWRQILTDVANIASLVSLAVSGYVAWHVRKIKNTYIFKIKAPGFVRVLSRHASTLIQYGNNFEDSKQLISVELTKIDVKIRSMQSRMRGEAKKAVTQLRQDIEDYSGGQHDQEKFYKVYNGMQRVIEEVKELQEDINLD